MAEINNTFIPKSFIDTQTGTLKVDQKLAETVQAGVQGRADKLPDVQKDAFLKMVGNLAPGDVDTPEELGAVLDMFETSAKLLSEPNSPALAFVGDISKFLARAMIEFAADQRQSALNERLQARASAKSELLSQADKMQQAADKMMAGATAALIAGVIGAAVSVVGSAFQAIGNLSQVGKMGTAMKDTREASKAASQTSDQLSNMSKISAGARGKEDVQYATNMTKAAQTAHDQATSNVQQVGRSFDKANASAQMYTGFGQLGNAMGDVSKSSGQGVDGRAQAEAKGLEAQGSRDAAEAQDHQAIADMKKEVQDQMAEFIKQVIGFLKDMKDSEIEAMRAITRG